MAGEKIGIGRYQTEYGSNAVLGRLVNIVPIPSAVVWQTYMERCNYAQSAMKIGRHIAWQGCSWAVRAVRDIEVRELGSEDQKQDPADSIALLGSQASK